MMMMVMAMMHRRLRRDRCSDQYDQRDHRKQNFGHLHRVSPFPCFNFTPWRSKSRDQNASVQAHSRSLLIQRGRTSKSFPQHIRKYPLTNSYEPNSICTSTSPPSIFTGNTSTFPFSGASAIPVVV